MYCKEALEGAKLQCRLLGHAKTTTHHKKPLGKDSIEKGMKEISKRLCLKDWENFAGQDLRAFMGTKLENDASVSMPEAMAALRHESVAAHKCFNKTSCISETNRCKALGIIKK